MSTHHDIENEQEARSRSSPPVQDEQVFSAPAFPQPPQRPPRPKGNRWVVITAIVVMLVLVVSLGVFLLPGVTFHPGGQVTPTPTSPPTQIPPTAPPTPVTPTPGTDITPTPAPGIVLGPQACPAGIGTPDLFREFDWSAGKNTLVQTAFPGIFPDLTRYQAEADQARVNKGQDTWKNDPKQVAQKLAIKFFDWKLPLTATLTSGGGAKDVYATVKVVETVAGASPTATVTLSRLEGNTHNMWVAIAVEDGADALTTIKARSLVASPVKFEGKGNSFEGDIGEAYILDHLYTVVGHAHLTAAPGIGMGVPLHMSMCHSPMEAAGLSPSPR